MVAIIVLILFLDCSLIAASCIRIVPQANAYVVERLRLSGNPGSWDSLLRFLY